MPTIAKRQDAFTIRSSETAGSRLGVDSLFVAVVHADDGVRFTATANSRRILVHRICEYVQEWGVHMLEPDHARYLRTLLARGEWEAAVELYFGLVGRRWDKEWLITAVVPASAHRDVVAVLGEVAVEEACKLRLDRGPPRGNIDTTVVPLLDY